MYVKCHTGVAVGLFTRINAGILDPDCIFFNVHNGSLNMLNDSINRHLT